MFANEIVDLSTILREADHLVEVVLTTEGRPEPPGISGYAMWAENYDDLGANPVVGGEEEVIDDLIGNVEGLRVLDVGCGTGRHALTLAERGRSLWDTKQPAKHVFVGGSEGLELTSADSEAIL